MLYSKFKSYWKSSNLEISLEILKNSKLRFVDIPISQLPGKSTLLLLYYEGSRTDPTCYWPIAVLPALSRVFEKLLVTQLKRRIDLYIPREQFGFMKG